MDHFSLVTVEFVYRIATSAGWIDPSDSLFRRDAYRLRPNEQALSVIIYPAIPQPRDVLELHERGEPAPGMFYGLDQLPLELIQGRVEVVRDSEFHALIHVGEWSTDSGDVDAQFLRSVSTPCWRISRAEVNELRLELGMGKY